MPPRRSGRKGSAAPSNASNMDEDVDLSAEQQQQQAEAEQEQQGNDQEEEEDQLEVENDIASSNRNRNGNDDNDHREPSPTPASQQLPFSTMRADQEDDEENKIKILVATDNQLSILTCFSLSSPFFFLITLFYL